MDDEFDDLIYPQCHPLSDYVSELGLQDELPTFEGPLTSSLPCDTHDNIPMQPEKTSPEIVHSQSYFLFTVYLLREFSNLSVLQTFHNSSLLNEEDAALLLCNMQIIQHRLHGSLKLRNFSMDLMLLSLCLFLLFCLTFLQPHLWIFINLFIVVVLLAFLLVLAQVFYCKRQWRLLIQKLESSFHEHKRGILYLQERIVIQHGYTVASQKLLDTNHSWKENFSNATDEYFLQLLENASLNLGTALDKLLQNVSADMTRCCDESMNSWHTLSSSWYANIRQRNLQLPTFQRLKAGHQANLVLMSNMVSQVSYVMAHMKRGMKSPNHVVSVIWNELDRLVQRLEAIPLRPFIKLREFPSPSPTMSSDETTDITMNTSSWSSVYSAIHSCLLHMDIILPSLLAREEELQQQNMHRQSAPSASQCKQLGMELQRVKVHLNSAVDCVTLAEEELAHLVAVVSGTLEMRGVEAETCRYHQHKGNLEETSHTVLGNVLSADEEPLIEDEFIEAIVTKEDEEMARQLRLETNAEDDEVGLFAKRDKAKQRSMVSELKRVIQPRAEACRRRERRAKRKRLRRLMGQPEASQSSDDDKPSSASSSSAERNEPEDVDEDERPSNPWSDGARPRFFQTPLELMEMRRLMMRMPAGDNETQGRMGEEHFSDSGSLEEPEEVVVEGETVESVGDYQKDL